MLEYQLKKIFASALPHAGLLEDLEKELHMSSWWTSFDDLLMLYDEEDNEQEDAEYSVVE